MSGNAVEVTVVLKDDEKTNRHKFLQYDMFTMSDTDPFILECIDEARKSFQGEPDDIIIKTSMTVK
jgi:hypothetical protein